MSQYIRLFEEDRDFVLCIDENNTFTGTYRILADTVFLSYREQVESSMVQQNLRRSAYKKTLPKTLYIDEDASQIESTDGQLFSAEISLDLREKTYESNAYSPSELQSQKDRILAFVGLK